ncbi:hypothetical protein KKE92_06445 [Candidatus Micrarchaeota archaeon]|nr:hypothetical protein [Candidatus Micrarchaeota archaeon]MBU1682282.1 hypothetical protein [Candidatus Micrarchaeota archaeon]
MRRLLFILLLFCGALSADCISCNELENASDANILTSMDDDAGILEIYVYYENLSVSPSRQPVSDFVLLVQMSNATGLNDLYRIYTDDEGAAIFDFNSRKSGGINFKILYCPFCDPSSEVCGFEACLNYSNIETSATSVDEIPLGLGASSTTIPATLNPKKYFPAIDQLEYSPPPAPMAATPGLCLPLLIIFSLLSGSLFLTGRNPFAGFNIGGMKVGKHIRYQARGRGYSFSGMAAISALVTVGSAIKTAGKGKGALLKSEKAAAKQRVFGYSGIKRASKGVKAFKASLRASTDTKSFTRQMNARISIRDVEGGESRASSGQATSQGMAFLPGGGGVRGTELVGSGGMNTLLRMALLVATQTSVGRLVDGFVYIHADQGLFDMAFVDHDQRRGEDMQAALSTIDEETGGCRMVIDGREVVVTAVTRSEPDARGNTFIESMEIVTGEVEGQVGDRRTLQLNSDGIVVGIQYQAAGVIPQDQRGSANPEGIGIVTITEAAEGGFTATITNRDGSNVGSPIQPAEGEAATGQRNPLVVSEGSVERVEWNNIAGPAIGAPGVSGDLAIGMNASEFVGTYETIMGNPDLAQDDPDRAGQRAMVLASARSEAQMIQTLRADDMTDDMTATDRSTARAQSATIASEAQQDVLGAHGVSIYAGLTPEDSPYGGQRTVQETAALRAGDVITGEYTTDSEGNPVSLARPATVVAHALEGSDLRSGDRDAVSAVISTSSAADLEVMDRTTLRNRVVDHLMVEGQLDDARRGLPPLTAEQTAVRMEQSIERANTILASVPEHTIERLQEAGSHGTGGFSEQFAQSPELARAYSTADISALATYAGDTSCLGDYEHNRADLIGRDPSAYSSDVSSAAMEYRAITGTMQQIDRIRTADTPERVLAARDGYLEMNNVYVETRLVNVAADQAETAADRQAIDTARQGLGHLYEQAEMAVSMHNPSEDQIQATAAAEEAARQRVRQQAEAVIAAETRVEASAQEHGGTPQQADVQALERARATAIESAIDARRMHTTAGNEYAVHMYDRVLEHYGVTIDSSGRPNVDPQQALPGDSLRDNVDISLRVMPPAAEVATRYARVSAEARAESDALTRIGVLATSEHGSHDYGTAMAAAAQQARYFRTIGDDARASQYTSLATDINRVRTEYRAARASGGTIDETERAALERSRAELNSQIGLLRGGAPLAPDQHGPRMPGAADVARETLDRRWQHMGLGHEALIQASGSDTPTPTVLGKTRRSMRPRPGDPRDGS